MWRHRARSACWFYLGEVALTGLVRNGVETTFAPATDVQPGEPGPFAHPHQFSVALTAPERRRILALLSILFFFVGAWARTNLMSADGGTISLAWWLVTATLSIAMLIVGKPGLPAALLGLAGALFGAAHPMPTGPLGLACFLGAALYNERQRTPIKLPNAE